MIIKRHWIHATKGNKLGLGGGGQMGVERGDVLILSTIKKGLCKTTTQKRDRKAFGGLLHPFIPSKPFSKYGSGL